MRYQYSQLEEAGGGEGINIGGRKIRTGSPCFIIGEAGVNHNGDIELARKLVDVAAKAGVDAIKFQTFRTDQVVSSCAPKAEYQLHTTNRAETQYQMLRRLEISPEDHRNLFDYCRGRGVLFMSTPFDEESVDLLNDLGVSVFKIPSGEITNLPLVKHVARQGKPIILSTGMSYLSEVDEAVRVIKAEGNSELVVLHCVSCYPASPSDANLLAMQTMATALHVAVGYSDHTCGVEVALAAVALGACVIEKHFTLDRTMPGPDHRASLEPDELAMLVRSIRTVESAMGHGRKEPAASESNTAAVARRSLVAAREIPAGMVLTKELIAIKRPGTGLPPSMLSCLLGRIARVNIPAGWVVTLEMLE